MIEGRLLILLLAVLVCALAYGLWRAFSAWRLRRAGATPLPESLTALVGSGEAALLYFTTEQCAQCRFQQSPILKQLTALTPIPVHEVNAMDKSDLVSHYGVMTVPTTVLLDRTGRPVAINHGVAPLQRLREQAAMIA
jgi:thioredoxin 1